jgi:hypothetical protein
MNQNVPQQGLGGNPHYPQGAQPGFGQAPQPGFEYMPSQPAQGFGVPHQNITQGTPHQAPPHIPQQAPPQTAPPAAYQVVPQAAPQYAPPAPEPVITLAKFPKVGGISLAAKLGISINLLAALMLFSGLMLSFWYLLIVAAVVMYFEEDEILRRAAVMVVGIAVFFTLTREIISWLATAESLLTRIISMITTSVNDITRRLFPREPERWTTWSVNIPLVRDVIGICSTVVSWLHGVTLVFCGLAALKGKAVKNKFANKFYMKVDAAIRKAE